MRIIPLQMSPFPCGYFDDRQANYEHYFILESEDSERQALLEMGYRSFGKYFFRPGCQGCHRCVPLRLPIGNFTPSKSQRRVLNRCADVRISIDTPRYTDEKYAIYQEHLERFAKPVEDGRELEFQQSFYDPTAKALEFSYYLGDQLIAVGIVNETLNTLSSVYFFYRMEHAKLSLGTFGVLKEIEYGLDSGKDFLYLGYWIRDNQFMRYKAEFRPNEILGPDGKWRSFRDSKGGYLQEESVGFPPCYTPLMDLPREELQ